MVKKFFRIVFNRVLWQTLLSLLVLAGAGMGAKTLFEAKQSPKKKPVEEIAHLVNVMIAKHVDHQVIVREHGTVETQKLVAVVPQVSGKVIHCHRSLVDGGFFKANEPLIQIEKRDFELVVERAKAGLAQVQTALDIEQAEAAVAIAEWKEMRGDQPVPPLVARQPQIAQHKAEMLAAQALLDKAKLDLQRTIISLPYDGRILKENVEIGQFLVAGQSIATIYGTQKVEITVPIENRWLAWFDLPNGTRGENLNIKTIISAKFAGKTHSWAGQLVRSTGQIDPKTRLIHAVIEVDKPFELRDGRPPLTPGMFVDVAIEGKTLKNVIPVPRFVVHDNNTVWIARNDRLKVVPIEIVLTDRKKFYISKGLEDGDEIIVTQFEIFNDGMKIKVVPKLTSRSISSFNLRSGQSQGGQADLNGTGVEK